MAESRQALTPPDPDGVQRALASFARQQVMQTLGITVGSAHPGRVALAMTHRPEFTQQHGFLHAGIVATALDSACGYAAFTLMPAGAGVLTIEFKINLIAPARGPAFSFEAEVVKPGRTISVVDGRAFQHHTDGGERKLIATMTATVMTIAGRDDVKG